MCEYVVGRASIEGYVMSLCDKGWGPGDRGIGSWNENTNFEMGSPCWKGKLLLPSCEEKMPQEVHAETCSYGLRPCPACTARDNLENSTVTPVHSYRQVFLLLCVNLGLLNISDKSHSTASSLRGMSFLYQKNIQAAVPTTMYILQVTHIFSARKRHSWFELSHCSYIQKSPSFYH